MMDSSTNGATPWPVSVRPVQGGPMQQHPTATKKSGDPKRCAVVKLNTPRSLDHLLRLFEAMAGTDLIAKPMRFAHGLDEEADACEFAPLVFLDADTEPKQPLPAEAWSVLLDLIADGKLPGVVFVYETAHGFRPVVLLDEPPTSLDQRRDVVRELHARMQPILDDALPLRVKLDPAMAGTQGVFAPGGVKADGTRHPVNVRRFNADAISTEAMAEAFAKRVADAEPAARVNDAPPKRRTIGGTYGGVPGGGGTNTLAEARAAWNDAHPMAEATKQECPLCESDTGFHVGGDGGAARWFCHSTNHATNAPPGVGQTKETGAGFGDALDLEAWRATLTPTDVLVRDGYWQPREDRKADTPDDADDVSPIVELWGDMPAAWVNDTPPPMECLLRYPDRNGEPCPPREGDALLSTGVVGVLSSAGGVGKTYVLIQLAIAIATGRDWLAHFQVGKGRPTRSLLLLGEEKPEECWRRVHAVADVLNLDAEDRALVRANVVVLPLHGVRAPLTVCTDDTLQPSRHFHALHDMMQRDVRDGWAFVGVDPMARFDGAESERSNPLATQFVQLLETLTQLPGEPVVMVSAHSSKAARTMGSADARGVTGLTDAARFHVTLASHGDSQGATWKVEKTNYGRAQELELVRRDGCGPLWFVEDDAERERREREKERTDGERDRAKDAAKAAQAAVRVVLVLRFLADTTTPQTNAEALGRAAGIGAKNNATAAVAQGVAQGLIAKADDTRTAPFVLTEAGRAHLAANPPPIDDPDPD